METVLLKSRFSFWDWTLGILLKIFWEPISIKRSHFWHWRQEKFSYLDSDYNYLVVTPDTQARNRHGFWSNLWQTNFGWQKVVVVEPSYIYDSYEIVFSTASGDYRNFQSCSLRVKGRVGLLIGPEETRFYAVSYNYLIPQQIPLRTVMITTKKELPQGIKLI